MRLLLSVVRAWLAFVLRKNALRTTAGVALRRLRARELATAFLQWLSAVALDFALQARIPQRSSWYTKRA